MRNERSVESSDTLHSSHDSETQDYLPNRPNLSEGMKITKEIENAVAALADISLPPLIEVPYDTSTYTAIQNARIRALGEETGRTRDEVITAALTLYELGLKAQQHHKKFGVVEPDQQLITEVGSL